MNPWTVECAIKGVYASLFNVRAIAERSNARYRHDTVAMGIAVMPQYKEIGTVTANAVAVTRYLENPCTHTPATVMRLLGLALPGYTFSVGEADNDVTNPDPGTMSETAVATTNLTYDPSIALYRGDYSVKISRYATPVAGNPAYDHPVMPLNLYSDMLLLTIAAERAYCLYGFNLSATKCDQLRYSTAKTALDMVCSPQTH